VWPPFDSIQSSNSWRCDRRRPREPLVLGGTVAPFGRNFLSELNCLLPKLVFRLTQDAESVLQSDLITLDVGWEPGGHRPLPTLRR
jgi:hypothetical protein